MFYSAIMWVGPMDIYILRHAIAEAAEGSSPDAGRSLTSEGKEALRRVLKRAKAAAVEPGSILTSPYTRAKETADLARAALNPAARFEETKALLPSSPPGEALSLIRRQKVESLMLVGHEPNLSRLAALLLGAPSLRIAFKKSAIIRIDLDASAPGATGELRWMLTNAIA